MKRKMKPVKAWGRGHVPFGGAHVYRLPVMGVSRLHRKAPAYVHVLVEVK